MLIAERTKTIKNMPYKFINNQAKDTNVENI